MIFDNYDEGLWAESQTPSEFKSKSDKKGKARKFWKRESFKKWLYASLTIYNVWVHIITSTQGVEVVKNEKENMHTPHCNLLRSSHNKKMGGGAYTEASFSVHMHTICELDVL